MSSTNIPVTAASRRLAHLCAATSDLVNGACAEEYFALHALKVISTRGWSGAQYARHFKSKLPETLVAEYLEMLGLDISAVRCLDRKNNSHMLARLAKDVKYKRTSPSDARGLLFTLRARAEINNAVVFQANETCFDVLTRLAIQYSEKLCLVSQEFLTAQADAIDDEVAKSTELQTALGSLEQKFNIVADIASTTAEMLAPGGGAAMAAAIEAIHPAPPTLPSLPPPALAARTRRTISKSRATRQAASALQHGPHIYSPQYSMMAATVASTFASPSSNTRSRASHYRC
jgi:hypothetical protein